jgi:manganese/iron transport system ATP-binding protein
MPTWFQPHAVHAQEAPTLELEHVFVHYNGTPALADAHFQIQRGEQVAVVGPNGAGKSTLFDVIAGTIKPSRGKVRVYGSGPGGHICIGYVPQRTKIDWRFPVSVADVVMMGRIGQIGLFRWPSRADWKKVHDALEQVDMGAFAQRQIGELSGGQQQRVFIARALAQRAELLLLDEPLTGLDMPSQEAILEILDHLRARGITILVATHDLNQAAGQFERMILLNRRIVADGRPEAVLTAQNLGEAYGGHLHVVPTDGGALLLADTCCGGGKELVEQPATARASHPTTKLEA